MSVWYAIPSKRPREEAEPVLRQWRERGYKIAVLRDEGEGLDFVPDYLESILPYPGYACGVNELVEGILAKDPACDWIVTGGDDVLPDPNHTAEEIARSCTQRFGMDQFRFRCGPESTFGVMQPTGDRWGDDARSRARYGEERGAYIDRVCGSPWMGREFCQRIYGGKGPLWPEFFHMYGDEHMQAVAEKLGILWQRRDLTQHHQHWGRNGNAENMPEFLKSVNTREHWDKSKAIFERLKAGGFAEATL